MFYTINDPFVNLAGLLHLLESGLFLYRHNIKESQEFTFDENVNYDLDWSEKGIKDIKVDLHHCPIVPRWSDPREPQYDRRAPFIPLDVGLPKKEKVKGQGNKTARYV